MASFMDEKTLYKIFPQTLIQQCKLIMTASVGRTCFAFSAVYILQCSPCLFRHTVSGAKDIKL